MKNKKWLAALAGAGCVLFFVENRRSNQCLGMNEYTIESHKIPKSFDGKKIAFLSDLHNNELGKDNEKIFRMLEEINPDYVFVGGDMIVSKMASDSETAIAFMTELAGKYTVYCGNGNHESRLQWKEEKYPETGVIYRNYIKKLKNAGVNHLYNETIRIEEGSDFIYLSELELSKDYYKKLCSQTLPLSYMESRLGTCEDDSFHILLSHNPAYFETYAQWGADLTLSGHVHGGIMRLPFLGGVISPSYELFPKYDGGYFEKEHHKMIISMGLGSHSIKIRLFNPPKIDVITLKREGKEKHNE